MGKNEKAPIKHNGFGTKRFKKNFEDETKL